MGDNKNKKNKWKDKHITNHYIYIYIYIFLNGVLNDMYKKKKVMILSDTQGLWVVLQCP